MIRSAVLLTLLVALVHSIPVRAQITAFPEIPELTVTIEPPALVTAGTWIYDQVIVRVQLASKHPFEALSFDFDIPDDVDHITLVRPRTRFTRSYAGAGHVYEAVWALFPKRSGQLEIPAARAVGRVENDIGESISFDAHGPSWTIEVAGIEPSFTDGWMVSRRVEISESWSKPPDQIRVHDIVRRTVEIRANGVSGNRITLPHLRPTRGLQVADAGAEISTETSATGIVGRLRQSWDLKIERGGVVYVAPVAVSWWHPTDRVMHKQSVRGWRLEPLPVDQEARVRELLHEARDSQDRLYLAAAIGLAVLLVPGLALLVIFCVQALPCRADRILLRGCRNAGTPEDLYRVVSTWSAATGIALPGDRFSAPASFAQLTGALFGSAVPPSAAATARELIALSRRQRFDRTINRLHRIWIGLVGPDRRL